MYRVKTMSAKGEFKSLQSMFHGKADKCNSYYPCLQFYRDQQVILKEVDYKGIFERLSQAKQYLDGLKDGIIVH